MPDFVYYDTDSDLILFSLLGADADGESAVEA